MKSMEGKYQNTYHIRTLQRKQNILGEVYTKRYRTNVSIHKGIKKRRSVNEDVSETISKLRRVFREKGWSTEREKEESNDY